MPCCKVAAKVGRQPCPWPELRTSSSDSKVVSDGVCSSVCLFCLGRIQAAYLTSPSQSAAQIDEGLVCVQAGEVAS